MRPTYLHDALLEAAETAAARLELEAARIRHDARAKATLIYRDQSAENAERAAALVADLIEDGTPPDRAIENAADRLGIPGAIVADHVKRSNRAAVVIGRWERDRRIIIAARRETNAEIARREGISESTVCRVIRKVYRTASRDQTFPRQVTIRPGD